jgi:hypothetical protein
MDKLKYLSLAVKKYPISERKQVLITKLGEINEWIEDKVKSKIG